MSTPHSIDLVLVQGYVLHRLLPWLVIIHDDLSKRLMLRISGLSLILDLSLLHLTQNLAFGVVSCHRKLVLRRAKDVWTGCRLLNLLSDHLEILTFFLKDIVCHAVSKVGLFCRELLTILWLERSGHFRANYYSRWWVMSFRFSVLFMLLYLVSLALSAMWICGLRLLSSIFTSFLLYIVTSLSRSFPVPTDTALFGYKAILYNLVNVFSLRDCCCLVIEVHQAHLLIHPCLVSLVHVIFAVFTSITATKYLLSRWPYLPIWCSLVVPCSAVL